MITLVIYFQPLFYFGEIRMNGLSMSSQPALAPAAPSIELSQQQGLNLNKVVVPTSQVLESLQGAPDPQGAKRLVLFEDLQAAAHRLGYGVNEADAKKHNLIDGSKPTTLGKFLDASKKADSLENKVKDVGDYAANPIESVKKLVANHVLPAIEDFKKEKSRIVWSFKKLAVDSLNDVNFDLRNLKPLVVIPLEVYDAKKLTPTITSDGKKETFTIGGDVGKGNGLQATLENGVLTMKVGGNLQESLESYDDDKGMILKSARKAEREQVVIAEPLSQMLLRALDHFDGRVKEIRSVLIAPGKPVPKSYYLDPAELTRDAKYSAANYMMHQDNFYRTTENIHRSHKNSQWDAIIVAREREDVLRQMASDLNLSKIYRLRGWHVDRGSVKVDGPTVNFTHSKYKN
jgi:hypothetical protein